jgi:hypothetical protein
MNCFQRKTRIDAPGSGAGPFQAGSARAAPGMSSNPAAPDCRTRRLVTSAMLSSLVGAAKRFFLSESYPACERAPRRGAFSFSCAAVSRSRLGAWIGAAILARAP